MLKHIIKQAFIVSLYLIIGGIVALVGLVILLRFELLDINDYRDTIQSRINQNTTYPINIGAINLAWDRWTPYLLLSNIGFFDKKEQHRLALLQSIHIDLNPVQLLRYKKFQVNLSGANLKLSLVRKPENTLALLIADIDIQQSAANNTSDAKNKWLEWMLNQRIALVLRDVQLSWIDLKLDKDTAHHISDATLKIKTFTKGMQINIDAPLSAQYGNSLELKIDVQGNPLTPDWSAQAYVAGKNILLQPFLPIPDFNIRQQTMQFELWLDWHAAQLKTIDGIISGNDIDIDVPTAKLNVAKLNVAKLNTAIAARRIDKDGWVFGVYPKEQRAQNTIPAAAYYTMQRTYNKDTGYTYAGQFEQIEIETIIAALKILSFIRKRPIDKLERYQLQGNLHDLTFFYNPASGNIQYKTDFSSTTLARQDIDIKLTSLAGSLLGDHNNLTALIDSDTSTLIAPTLFSQTMQLSKIKGQIELSKTATDISIKSPLLTLRTADFPLRLVGSMRLANEPSTSHATGSPVIDAAILATLTDAPLDKLVHYIPNKINPELKKWSAQALSAGKVDTATVLLHGPLQHYPYEKKEGVLKITAEISEATIKYHNNWPALTAVKAKMNMENDSVAIDINSGKIYAAAIKKAVVKMPNIKKQGIRIMLNGTLETTADQLSLFIKNSPFGAKKALLSSANSLAGGDVVLDLELDLPLYNQSAMTTTNSLRLFDARLVAGKLSLDAINGTIHFTQDTIDAEKISARYGGKPITFSVHKNAGKPLEYLAEGVADHAFILQQLMLFLPNLPVLNTLLQGRIKGESHWQMRMHTEANHSATKTLLLQSDLYGMALHLPTPFAKKQLDRQPFSLQITQNERTASQIKLSYGAIDVIIDTEEKSHDKRRSIQVQGELAQLSPTDWAAILGDHSTFAKNTANTTGNIKYDIDIDVAVARLALLSQEFDDVKMTTTYIDDKLVLNIAGKDIHGELQYTDDIIIAHLKRLALKKKQPVFEKQPAIDTAASKTALPSLKVQIDTLHYEEHDLGQFQLDTRKVTDGIKIEKIILDKPGIRIDGDGGWNMIAGQQRAHVNIDLHAEKIANILALYGHTDSEITDGETHIRFYLNWDDTLNQIAPDKVRGTINVAVGNGALQNIDLSNTNLLLNALSLQSLPYWLRLDFSSLFGGGFLFHKISGNFDLEAGSVYTRDLSIQGVAADIEIDGRIGLLDMDYDKIVTVTPNATSNLLPVSPFLGPIGIGIGATLFFLEKLFPERKSRINTFLEHKYKVSGSWAAPLVEKINEKEASQAN